MSKQKQELTKEPDELFGLFDEFAHLARLALAGQGEDARLYVARVARKLRATRPVVAGRLEELLKARPTRSASVIRRTSLTEEPLGELPVDQESRRSLLKVFTGLPTGASPLLAPEVEAQLSQLIRERRHADRLVAAGLQPSRSAIFVGPPGVGKTLSARWLAAQLELPLYVLDLTTVMSSLLGKTGSNLRAAMDFARSHRAVLLLDEIDAVAKRRGDDTDVGELKRLVTVMLQEVENWPAEGLLLAATNHPELIDPALWRRFDQVVHFPRPSDEAVGTAISRFLGDDRERFARWLNIFVYMLRGESFSDIERDITALRRMLLLGDGTLHDVVEHFITARVKPEADRRGRVELASLLARETRFSQHAISAMTGVSRDTIRKHSRAESA